ncbi:MAG: flavodoxin domain-containing protein [Gammaproteobacteria bacterium]|nr:flavodoxin domain-containing protein [Gammaproteobacteria bacterium]
MITIIVGTETGTAEYVADEILELLEQHQLNAEQTLTVDPNQLINSTTWLICTSTHGAGDVPNNLHVFQHWLTQSDIDLSEVNFGVIALGDSSYDTFCQAGEKLRADILKLGATEIFPIIKIDAMDDELPEEIALEKLKNYVTQLKN